MYEIVSMLFRSRNGTTAFICYYFAPLMAIIVSVASLNTLQRRYPCCFINLEVIVNQNRRQRRQIQNIHREYLISVQRQRRQRHWMTSSSTTDQEPQTVLDIDDHRHPLVTGGSFVGLHATFDASNGKHLPIDERYIPSSLLEWGYPPSTLETVVSETIQTDESQTTEIRTRDNANIPTHHVTAVTSMTRSIATILPATGCDNDNLETLSSTDHWTKGHTVMMNCRQQRIDLDNRTGNDSPLTANQSTDTFIDCESALLPSMDFITTIHNKKLNQYGIETCFRWTPSHDIANHDYPKPLDDVIYRIRVNVDFERICPRHKENTVGKAPTDQDHRWKLLNPIGISLERRISNSSNDTAINDYIKGGGLDSRTVTQWLGPILKREAIRSFPKTMVNENPFVSNCKDDKISIDTKKNANIMTEFTIPGNITISSWESASDQYYIEIGHIIRPLQHINLDSCSDKDIDVVGMYHRLVVLYNISMSDTLANSNNIMIHTNIPFSVELRSRLEQLPRR
jgi:ribosomal protein L31